jgi:hypothetical protein
VTQFSAGALPVLPGAYFDFEARPVSAVPPAIGSVVAVPFTHSWGPDNAVKQLDSMADFSAVYKNDLTATGLGYRAVRQAFVGEGVNGRTGAGSVLAYRMCAASAAKAAVTLQNTTPAAALTVSAIYKGTLGNSLKVTIQTDPNDATKRDLIVMNGAVVVETWVYDPAVANPLATLAAAVNGSRSGSPWPWFLTGWRSRLSLRCRSPAATDGATLTTTEWTNAMNALGAYQFDYFAPFDLTDAPTITSIKTWAQNAQRGGQPVLRRARRRPERDGGDRRSRRRRLSTTRTSSASASARSPI